MPFPPAGHSTILNALRVALRIISGKYIFKFAILENLRIFQNCLFTGGVWARTLSGISLCSIPAPPKGELFGCCRKAVPQHKAGSLSPSSLCDDASPKGRGIGIAEKFPTKPQSIRQR